MATVITMSPAVRPPVQLALASSQPARFDAEFLDRRMRLHREWQERIAEETTEEILRECLDYVGRGLQQMARMR
jgi:hypothetical protein